MKIMVKMKKIIFILIIFIISCAPAYNKYSYEICNEKNQCKKVTLNKIITPNSLTEKLCNPNWLRDKANSECENVSVNQLLFKTGTTKILCNHKGVGNTIFVDNWWNAEGLIDDCEMPVNSNMQFIFKQHNQSIKSHTGTIQIKMDLINLNNNYKVLQIFTGEDNNNDNLPDEWKHCGNVYEMTTYSTRIIQCKGVNLKFIKLVNAKWSIGSLFIDNIEVLSN